MNILSDYFHKEQFPYAIEYLVFAINLIKGTGK